MPLLNENDVTLTAAEIAAALPDAEGNLPLMTVTGFSTDTRTIPPGSCFIALKGERFNGNLYAGAAAEKGAAMCILSERPPEDPGVPYLLVRDTVDAYGAVARYWLRRCRESGLRVVAVTGSSGKTTVKDMIAHVLAKKFRTYCTGGNHNNHIGVPYTALHMPQETEVAVIEMGMNHAGEIHRLTTVAEPEIAVITNIGTAHIGNLGSQENILRAKLEILDGMNGGTLLAPADDPLLKGAQADIRDRVTVRYSTRFADEHAELCADHIEEAAEYTRFLVHINGEDAPVSLPMTGLHNVTDALLAIHAGLCCGMTLADCAAALADFAPGEIRSGRVQIGNCTIIRDYYNANPEAMAASLQALGTVAGDAKKIALLGNMNELGDFAGDRHRALGALCKTKADAAFFCGANYADFAEGYGSGAAAFAEQSELIAALRQQIGALTAAPCVILIKGSRGLHMENVYDALTEALTGNKS